MDITDLFAIQVVQGLDPGTPLAPCGAGTEWNESLQLCVASPSTLGEGNEQQPQPEVFRFERRR